MGISAAIWKLFWWREGLTWRSLCVILEKALHIYFWHSGSWVISRVNFKCIRRMIRQRFCIDHVIWGRGKGESSEIGTLSFLMLVTLNFYITSSPIQMSSQSKFLKYFENLSKSLNQMWKHPSKCTRGCQSRRWGWEVSVTGSFEGTSLRESTHFISNVF